MAAQTGELDQLISALKGGLTSVPPATAVSIIDSFEKQASGAGATSIANNLTELKKLLTSGSGSGSEIGKVLASLGKETTGAASSADGELSSKLKELGQVLTQAGGSLG